MKKDKILMISSFILVAVSIILFIIFFTNNNKGISYSLPNSNFKVGDTFNLDGKYKDKELVYISENPSIVEVNKKTGEKTAKKERTTTIEIYAKDDSSINEYIKISVKNNDLINKKTKEEQKPTEEVKQVEDIKPTTEETKPTEQPKQQPVEQPAQQQPTQPVTQQPTTEETKPTEQPKQQPVEQPTTQNTIIRVSYVELDNRNISILVGESAKINANVKPSNATNKGILWSSNNLGVATVDQNGNIKGISAGVAIITATSIDGGVKNTAKVVVNEPIKITGISLDPNQGISLLKGESVTLTTTIIPSNATNKELKWEYDENIVSLNNGVLTGINEGRTNVIVSSPDGTVTNKLSVIVYPTTGSIEFDKAEGVTVVEVCGGNECSISKYVCKVGKSFGVLITAMGGNSSSIATVKSYTSNNKTVATIKTHPSIQTDCINCTYTLISCKSKGKATITATNSLGGKAYVTVEVK
jgi:uncharacterized protein YjdB